MQQRSASVQGIGFLVLGLFIFSLQDIVVKTVGSHYPVLEIVTFRSLISTPLTLLLFRLEGGRGIPRTTRYREQSIRGVLYFLSYVTGFMGIAALPLADVAAIKFAGPLLITLFSVIWLGEQVGIQRWVAMFVGFSGVLLVVQPGGSSFNIGSVFVLVSVLCYALTTMYTRRLQTTDSSATMSFYTALAYLVGTAVLIPLTVWFGMVPDAPPSIAFLLRPWAMPPMFDLLVMTSLGLVWAGGMYSVAKAYSIAQAGVVAPFEYSAMPMNVAWGYLLWSQIPTLYTILGTVVTLLSGLYIFRRQQRENGKR